MDKARDTGKGSLQLELWIVFCFSLMMPESLSWLLHQISAMSLAQGPQLPRFTCLSFGRFTAPIKHNNFPVVNRY